MVENIAKSYSEVDVILSKLDRRYYNKISKGFLNYININEDKEYKTYFVNNENSIKINIKMNTNGKTYQMETFYNNDITKFVENFNSFI